MKRLAKGVATAVVTVMLVLIAAPAMALPQSSPTVSTFSFWSWVLHTLDGLKAPLGAEQAVEAPKSPAKIGMQPEPGGIASPPPAKIGPEFDPGGVAAPPLERIGAYIEPGG